MNRDTDPPAPPRRLRAAVAGLAGVGLAVAACFAGSVLVDAPPPAVSGSSVLLVEDTSLGTVDGHHTRRAEIRQVHSVAC